MNFATFYQQGGLFMHVITLLAIIVATVLVRRIQVVRRTLRNPNADHARLRHRDALTPALVTAMALVGLLGTAMGWVELNAALRTVPVEHWPQAASMGAQIASYTLVWGLLCAVPMTIGHGVLSHFETRLRGLIEKHA